MPACSIVFSSSGQELTRTRIPSVAVEEEAQGITD